MKRRDGSAVGGTPGNQLGGGGSIPASSLFFHVGCVDEANFLVMKYHYSRRIPSNMQMVGTLHMPGGLFGSAGECVAACYFCIPPTRWSEPLWQLSRLVRKDGLRVPLTFLIRMTVAKVKRTGLCDLLVSFADETERHHGGIYQAAGWKYDGKRDSRMDGIFVDGQFVTGRNANHIWGTQSPTKLAERGVIAEPHYDAGKHLYWRALNLTGDARAKRLGLRDRAYPKPRRDSARDSFSPRTDVRQTAANPSKPSDNNVKPPNASPTDAASFQNFETETSDPAASNPADIQALAEKSADSSGSAGRTSDSLPPRQPREAGGQ